jgi:hypothetical protein
MSNSQKTSQFTKLTSLNDSTNITLVDNGQNFTISFANFKTALGVTGTLTAIGDGTPVLNVPTAGNYQIRDIESGAGVIANTSAGDGVKIAWNVAQNATGFPLTSGLANAQPVISSLVAGVGIELTQLADAVSVTATGELGLIVIKQESDYPNQDATNVFLDAGTLYLVANSYTHTKPFICADGSAITALNQLGVTISYAGVTDLFTGVDVNFKISEIGLDAPNAQFFNFRDGSVLNANIFYCANLIGVNCAKFGTLDSMASLVITDTSVTTDATDGLTILGSNWRVWRVQNSGFITSSASFVGIDMSTATASAIAFGPLIFVGQGGAGAVGVSGLVNSGNVIPGNTARITQTNYLGNVIPLSGLTNSDIRWEFSGNSVIPDSISDGLMHVSGSSTETVISSAGVDVKMTNTWTQDNISRFSFDGAGRLTYIGERDLRLPIDISATLLMASGGDKQVEVSIAINGTSIAATTMQATVSAAKAGSISSIWQHDFVTGDYVELFVGNLTDTVNIIGQQAALRIN